MNCSLSALCLVTLALGAVAATPAHAIVAIPAGCITYTASNGTTGFPGTPVGTVGSGPGQVCQIGNISNNNVSGSGVFVNNSQPTSIYSFTFGGGALNITEKLGNNGIGDAVNVTLDRLSSPTGTTPSATISSIRIPFTSGPSGSYTLLASTNLAAGTYAIENQLAPNVDDPTFQINFSTAVPEPATLAVLLAPLAAMTMIRRRRRGTITA